MLVYALWKAEGEPEPAGENIFGDVASGSWYEKAVLWATETGIMKGHDDSSFGPNEAITREQLAVTLYRYAAYKHYDLSAAADLSVYTDADKVSSWTFWAMRWAVGNGLFKGMIDTQLDPAGYATRAQVAVMLMKLLGM